MATSLRQTGPPYPSIVVAAPGGFDRLRFGFGRVQIASTEVRKPLRETRTVREAEGLQGLDPEADQIIVATARREATIAVSKGRKIRDYAHVRTLG